MATTTTNFGWDIPQSTDLVKDGATAIATLGQDIDTAFVDLKGGTTGQVLSKNSGTDLDFTWVAQDDSNAIQNAIVDAKGDLISATAADTPARLGVGTNGQVLTADSTAATGLKWSTIATGSTFAGCRLWKDNTQALADDTNTIVTWNQESFDTDAYHDNSTNNSRITIPSGKAGKYLFTCILSLQSSTAGTRFIRLRKNGTNIANFGTRANNATGYPQNYVGITSVENASVGDYFEIQTWQNSGEPQGLENGETQCIFSAAYLGA